MIHTDEENLTWWNGMTKAGQVRVFQILLERALTKEFELLVLAMRHQWVQGKRLGNNQIALIRRRSEEEGL